jgi:hypothetical protein
MPSWSDFLESLKNEGTGNEETSNENTNPKPKPKIKKVVKKTKLTPEEEEKRRSFS